MRRLAQQPCGRAVLCARLWFALGACITAIAFATPRIDAAGENERPLITDPDAVWTMPLELRGLVHRCRFEGRVNFADQLWKNMWIEGPYGARYVQLAGRDLPLRSGDQVVIEGTLIPARGLDGETVSVTVLGSGAPVEPLPTTGRFADIASFTRRVVTTEAYIDDQQLIDDQHLRLYLIVEDRPAIGWMPPADPERVPDLRRKFVRITAVYSGRLDPTGTESSVELWAARPSDITVTGAIEAAPQFNIAATEIGRISEVPRGTKARVRGRLQRRDPGSSIVVRDGTGEITVRTLQRERIPVGVEVEAVGTVQVAGTRWLLDSALFRVSLEADGRVPTREAAEFGGVLSRVEQVRQLNPMQAGEERPVDLFGSVVWAMPGADFFYLHDLSGGVRIHRHDGISEPPLQKSVRVVGRTRPGPAGAEIEAAQVIDVGTMAHPNPKLISVAQARTGAEDGQWVAIRGFLREVVSEGDWRWIHVTGADGDFVGHLQSPVTFVATPGSLIRVHGICESVFAEAGRITGTRLRVPFLHDITIEEDAPTDLFDLPVQPLDGLRQLGALRELARARVTGTVLHEVTGEGLVIQEGGMAVRVLGRNLPAVVPGDRIDAVGIVGRAGVRVVLREALVRRTGGGQPPAAVELSPRAPLARDLDERLVRIRASVADRVDQPGQVRLTLRDGDVFFEGVLAHGGGIDERVRQGAVVDVTGLYRIEYNDAREARGFHLQLRSPADIAVARAARFWTVRRLFAVSGLLSGALLFSAGTAVFLRRRVVQQTGEIRRQVERQARLEAELERALRFKSLGLLAGGLAHDFNNLLTSIMGNASVALFDKEVARRAGDCLRDIEDSAGRAHQLTQQLVTFAKGGDPMLEPVDLASMLQDVFRRVLAGARVRAEFEPSPELWPVNVDRGQMMRALENLLMRARLEPEARGGVVAVAARNRTVAAGGSETLEPGRYVEIELRGCGGPVPEDQQRIFFDPYAATTSDSNRFSMAIAYSILRRHGGLVALASAPGEGAVFHIWIRAAEGVAPPARAPAPEPVAGRALLDARVLLMDDEEAIRRLGERCLRHLGCEVQVAADGGECVRIYQAAMQRGRRFDVVILDLTVPGGLGGRETIEALKSIDPSVRAIVSSGYSNDPVMARYREHGFVAVVPKPYSIDALTTTLQGVLAMPG